MVGGDTEGPLIGHPLGDSVIFVAQFSNFDSDL